MSEAGTYSCDVALSGGRWYLAYACSPDVDAAFVAHFGRHEAELKPGASEADWADAMVQVQREVRLITEGDAQPTEETLSQASRVGGPCMVGGDSPAAIWTECTDDQWRLMAYEEGMLSCLATSSRPLRSPSATRDTDGRLWCACDSHQGGEDVLTVRGVTGEGDAPRIVGRRPRLASGPEGAVWLAYEAVSRSVPRLCLTRLDGAAPGSPLKLTSTEQMNFSVDLIVDGAGCPLLVWETSPCWGEDERFGLLRQLTMKKYDPVRGELLDGPGTEQGTIPIPLEAFRDMHVQNLVPVNPRLCLAEECLFCTYRVFRYGGHKSFGWHLCEVHLADGEWTPPRAPGRHYGFGDTSYGVAVRAGSLLVAVHCCEHLPRATFAEERQGREKRDTQPAIAHRVELWEQPIDSPAPDVSAEYETVAPAIPSSVREPAPEPGPLHNPPAGRRLVWGDLHAHSCFSKCMSANDGLPSDVIRWERERTGCRVLCLTEHIEYMSALEFQRAMDLVEEEAGEGVVPLYGVEWAKYPAHHTNFFCRDRETFERLRIVLLRCDHLTKVFERVKQDFPPRSVVAIRHFHGMSGDPHGVGAPEVTATFDPDVERAMEVAQIRGDMLFNPPKSSRSTPAFPGNFLLAGAQLGIVAGSDHARGGPLKFCLTGFWVPEVTPEAIFDAILDRQTIGCVTGKLAIWWQSGETAMGGLAEATGSVDFQVELSAAHELRRLWLWRDGEWIVERELSGSRQSLRLVAPAASPGRHCYLVRAEATPNVADLPVVGYSSPIWVQHR